MYLKKIFANCYMFLSSSDPVCKYYLEMFFANPEIVAKANIPNNAKPSNMPAP